MTILLDHLIITVADLDAAIQHYMTLGYTVRVGGIHADGATHNALIVFADESYLELLAKTHPDAKTGYQIYFDQGEGISGYALRVPSLEAVTTRLTAHGIPLNDCIQGGRRRTDGIALTWQVVAEVGQPVPFYIEDTTERGLRVDMSAATHANGATGIHTLHFVTTQWDTTAKRLSLLLNADPTYHNSQQVSWQVGATTFTLHAISDPDNARYAHALSRSDVPYAMATDAATPLTTA